MQQSQTLTKVIAEKIAQYRIVIFLVCITVTVAVVYASFFPYAKTASDTEAYLEEAQRIIAGENVIGQPPLLPVLLALTLIFKLPIQTIIVINIIGLAISCYLFFFLVKKHMEEKVAYIATILLIVTPLVTNYTLIVLTESLSLLFIILTLYLTINNKPAYAIFISLALAIAAKYLSVIIVPFVVWHLLNNQEKKKLLHIILYCIGALSALILISPSIFVALLEPFLGTLITLSPFTENAFWQRESLKQTFQFFKGSISSLTPYVSFFVLHGILSSIKYRIKKDLPLYAMTVSLLAILFIDQNWQNRFAIPIIPLYMMFAGYGCVQCFKEKRNTLILLLTSIGAMLLLNFYNELLKGGNVLEAYARILFPFLLLIYTPLLLRIKKTKPGYAAYLSIACILITVVIMVKPSLSVSQKIMKEKYSYEWIFKHD